MQFAWETPVPRSRPTTFMFKGLERKSGQIREGMISAVTKRSAHKALRRQGLRKVKLELA